MSDKKIVDKDFIRAYYDGMSYRQMAKQFQVAESTIQSSRKRLKLPKRGAPTKQPNQEPKDSDNTYILMIAKCPFCYSTALKLNKMYKPRKCYTCKKCMKDFMTPDIVYHSTKVKINRGIKAKIAFDRNAFIKDAKDGMSNNKLSQKYRMAHATVAKRLREFGISHEAEKPKLESIIPVRETLTVEKTVKKKRLMPPLLKEIERQQLEEKIRLTRQINKMSDRQKDNYLEESY